MDEDLFEAVDIIYGDTAPNQAELLETFLLSLMKGEFSSLTLSCNDYPGPNYQRVADVIDDANWPADWVSEEEKRKANENNRMWVLHWYPNTPVSFYAIAASSIEPLLLKAQEIMCNEQR